MLGAHRGGTLSGDRTLLDCGQRAERIVWRMVGSKSITIVFPRIAKGSDMTERGVTLIDVDENRLELWLKPDRVQLVVIDSRPELEAGELRRFASILFSEYVGRDLAVRLTAARVALQEARAGAAGDELIGSLDGA